MTAITTLKHKAEMLLPILTLLAQGKTVQWMWRKDHEAGSTTWVEVTQNELKHITSVNDPNSIIWRIKPEPKKTVPYKRFIAEHRGMKYVALKYDHDHEDFRFQEDRPWYGTFVAWIDTEWQTHEIPNQEG